MHGTIQHNSEDGLGGTCIVDDLPCKEQVLVLVGEALAWFGVLGPLKQEDESVNGVQSLNEHLIVEAIDLLHLNVRNAYL